MIKLESYQSGHYETAYQYKYFVPSLVNDEWAWNDPAISHLLENAAVRLGELNAYARFVPDISQFIQLHVTKEAVLSSRIEGTQTEMDEAILPKEEIALGRKDDWQEVNNYIQAMNQAIEDLKSLPISSRLIRNTHQVLLQGVRGANKLPGSYRNSQNWIGGSSLADAVFIPPSHLLVNDFMGDLEKFLNNDQIKVPKLIRIAIAHYQFETIHPFLDGNGRMGRLLITLYLVSEGLLGQPLLYLSSYFERDKGLYYDNLMNVRTKSDMIQWLKYFLVGIEDTAAQSIQRLTAIVSLKERVAKEVQESFGRRRKAGQILIEALFRQPAVTVDQIATICGLSFKAANDLAALAQKRSILKELTGNERKRIFLFDEYLRVFDN